MERGWYKNWIKHTLLRKANFRRIHIIGCARSGTTLLNFVLSGFRNTILHQKEVSVWNWPSLRQTFSLVRKYGFGAEPFFLVTKRNATWWIPEKLERLIRYTERFQIGIIYLIRDPRDVLTSKHALDERQYYVSFDTWKHSIEAGELVLDRLKNYPGLLIIRYEDLIEDIHRVEKSLKATFGLQLKPNVASLSRLNDYLDEDSRKSRMIQYMHGLRNFDSGSINKWKKDPKKRHYLKTLWEDPEKRGRLESVLKKYNYSLHSLEKEDTRYER